jgi:glycopeptide antibiotics resistance protein
MLPLFLPGVAISIVVGLVASGALGRALDIRRAIAFVMVLSLGIIFAATLTPQAGALGTGARGPGYCDFSRIWLAPWERLLSISDASGNVLMFIPLGVTIGLVPRSRRKAAIVVGAIALPFAIEMTQLLVPAMDRACESADVVDNLMGLALGLVAGVVAGRIARGVDRPPG